MPYNGAGVFNRLYNWVTDAAANIKILASRMDSEMDGFATGLSTCVTKDGQTQPTADLPMSGYKHTNVGNASLRNQYVTAGQYQDGDLTYGTDSGSSTAYTIGLNPSVTAYTSGMRVAFKALNANNGPPTISISGLTAVSLRDSAGNFLESGAISIDQIIEAIYDGTYFRIISNNDVAETQALVVVGNELYNYSNFT